MTHDDEITPLEAPWPIAVMQRIERSETRLLSALAEIANTLGPIKLAIVAWESQVHAVREAQERHEREIADLQRRVAELEEHAGLGA